MIGRPMIVRRCRPRDYEEIGTSEAEVFLLISYSPVQDDWFRRVQRSAYQPNLPDAALHIEAHRDRCVDAIGIHPDAVAILEPFDTDIADAFCGSRRDAGVFR